MTLSGQIPNPNKAGIALVMVLGFLALLIIAAVSFSILMRTERLAARSYVDVLKARNLLQLGLARAIDDVNNQLGGPDIRVYPENTVMTPSLGVFSTESITNLWSGSATNYTPHAFRGEVNAVSGSLPWVLVRDQEHPDRPLVGRYTFIAIDSGGFLDANIVSGDSDSYGYGDDPRDIRLAAIPEFRDSFAETRSNLWVRFESYPELDLASRLQFSSADSRLPSNTFIYSRFPNMYLDSNNQGQPRVQLDPNNVAGWNFAQVTNALGGVGPDTIVPDPAMFFGVMQDYASDSYAPLDGNYNRINARRVPMLNEVIVSNRFSVATNASGARVTHEVSIVTELAYPFALDTTDPSFLVRVEPVINALAVTAGGPSLFPSPVDEQIDLAPPVTLSAFDYSVVTNVFTRTIQLGATEWPASQFVIQVRIPGIDIQESAAGVIADRISAFNNSAFQWRGAPPSDGGALEPWEDATGYSALDPRINWDPSDTSQWDEFDPLTPGTRNTWLQDEIVNRLNINDQEVERSHSVGPGERMRTIGELSYLLYDVSKPWTTIRLLDNPDFPEPDNPAEVFDRFTIYPTNRPATYGWVNPNTPQDGVIAAVLASSRSESYPGEGEDDPDGPDAGDVDTLTQQIRDFLDDGQFMQRSELTQFTIPEGATDRDKFEVESIMRNAIELFDTQQNLITLILAAQAITEDEAGDETVLAETRAVALVWRDPYLNADGEHDIFVRYFRWLQE